MRSEREVRERGKIKSIAELKKAIKKVIDEFPNHPDYAIPHISNLINEFEAEIRKQIGELESTAKNQADKTTEFYFILKNVANALRRVLGREAG